MADASEDIYNKKLQQIVFYHPYTGSVLGFKAFLTNYQESYRNSWEEKELVRRLNKQYTFNAVYRTIQLGWSMPAYSIEEAKSNLEKCSMFVRMLYPAVDEHGTVIGKNPVWFLSLMNLVHNAGVPSGGPAANDGANTDSSLKGFPSNFSWEPILEEGVFDEQPGYVYPKVIRVSCDYNVLVDERKVFGWRENKGKYSWSSDAEHYPWALSENPPSSTGAGASGVVSSGGLPDSEPTAAADAGYGDVNIDAELAEDLGLSE